MHCHLDFAGNALELAEAAARGGVGMLCATVEPAAYERAQRTFGPFPNVRVGLGLHPWWVADGRCGEADVALFERLAADAPVIAEVGLDFGHRFSGTEEAQVAAFERVLAACAAAVPGAVAAPGGAGAPLAACAAADGGGSSSRVISLHAVRAAGTVLDLLERFDLPARTACVFHWFSGTSDELRRAIDMGCLFSVGARMLATKRGRAYAKAIPADRLLLETDFPPEPAADASPGGQLRLLQEALAQLEELRGEPLAERIARTSRQLLGVR